MAFLLANVAICGTTIRAERTDASPQADAPQASRDAGSQHAAGRPAVERNASAGRIGAGEDKPKAADKPAPPMQIQVWWGMRGTLGAAFQKQVKRFNESQDRIRVEVRLFDGYGAVHKELNGVSRRRTCPTRR